MSLIALASLSVLGLGTDPAEPAFLQLAQSQPYLSTQGAMAPRGDYMTTPEGCTYRKTQAPGYPPMWILVLNPHHLGLPNSPRACKGMR